MDKTVNTIHVIEELRKELVKIVKVEGSFVHPDVVEISQRLDNYINQYQKTYQKK